jgi:ubiquinone/menaquinone biosynthesis C-methylase UbiE
VIEHNRNRYPEARWITSSAYRLPLRDDSVDACFSMYVLEHLVCPVKILDEMLRVTKEGGHAFLLFPDFLKSGRFVSQQQAGFGFGTAKEKLIQGTLLDTVVTFYDNRLRFPKMLKGLKRRIGGFTVHLQPACLYYPNMAHPDYDAVYILLPRRKS